MEIYKCYFVYLNDVYCEKNIYDYLLNTDTTAIYNDFEKWCELTGLRDYNRTAFGIAIKKYYGLSKKNKQLHGGKRRYQKNNDDFIPEKISEKIKSGYIYFISDGTYVKIGVATDIEKRLRALQIGNSNKLNVIKKIYSDNVYDVEKALHETFKKYRIRGEWYNILSII